MTSSCSSSPALARTGDTYPSLLILDVLQAVYVNVRRRTAGGVWSRASRLAIGSGSSSNPFNVTLAAGEAMGLHIEPQGVGVMNMNHLRLYW